MVSIDLPSEIICKVVNGGTISNRKGVNVPGVSLSMPYISEKDYDDLVFGVEQEVDFIAASFTRSAQDILDIRKILDSRGCHWIKICLLYTSPPGFPPHRLKPGGEKRNSDERKNFFLEKAWCLACLLSTSGGPQTPAR